MASLVVGDEPRDGAGDLGQVAIHQQRATGHVRPLPGVAVAEEPKHGLDVLTAGRGCERGAGAVMGERVQPGAELQAVGARDISERRHRRAVGHEPGREPSQPGGDVLNRRWPVELAAGIQVAVDRLGHALRHRRPDHPGRQRLLRDLGDVTGVVEQQLKQEYLRSPVAALAGPLGVGAVEQMAIRSAAEVVDRGQEVLKVRDRELCKRRNPAVQKHPRQGPLGGAVRGLGLKAYPRAESSQFVAGLHQRQVQRPRCEPRCSRPGPRAASPSRTSPGRSLPGRSGSDGRCRRSDR